MILRLALLLALLLGLAGTAAHAHEVRPALLEIEQLGPTSYRLRWKRPMMGDFGVHLVPHLSTGWFDRPPRDRYMEGSFLIDSWRIDAAKPRALDGARLRIAGLKGTITDVVVRIAAPDGTMTTHVLRGDADTLDLGSDGAAPGNGWQFLSLGVAHILGGPDHLLFVTGLLLIATSRRRLIRIVTGFTIGHSITLGLATLFRLNLPVHLLNALIALSILFLAVEIARVHRGRPASFGYRHPMLPAFGFGLLHGLGFATGLTSLELDRGGDLRGAAAVQPRRRTGPARLYRLPDRARARAAADAVRLAAADRDRVGPTHRNRGGLLALPIFGSDAGGSRMTIRRTHLPLAVLALAMPSMCEAHVGHGGGGFVTGFLHPLSGLDHILAMLAVGIWGAQLARPAIWVLPVVFPLVMAVGGFLGLVGVALPGVEIGIALSALMLGAAIALRLRPPLAVVCAMVGLFGLVHGYAHGAEMPPSQDAARFSLGFVTATGLLHLTGVLIGEIHRWRSGVRALRGVGAAIAAGGAVFLWQALS